MLVRLDMASYSEEFAPDSCGMIIGRRLIRCDVVPSTMGIAREEARASAIEGTVITATRQIAGRGRHQRVWISPPGSISLSLVLYPQVEELSQIVMLASVAVAHVISRLYSLQPTLKWPNDVLLEGKKVAGILTESSFQGERLLYTVIGIGINANVSEDAIAVIPGATSLLIELGYEVSLPLLTKELITELDHLYRSLKNGSGEIIYEEWSRLQIVLGKSVVIETKGCSYRGYAENVSPDGRLWIRGDSGSITPFSSGEVNWCRLEKE